MTVGDLITMLRAYPNDDEIEIQVFETNSGELIDSTSAIGIVGTDTVTHSREIYPPARNRTDLRTQCCRINIEKCLPQPSLDVSFKDIINFKNKRRDALNAFRAYIRELERNIYYADSPELIRHYEAQFIEGWQQSTRDFHKVLKEAGIGLFLSSMAILVATPFVSQWLAAGIGQGIGVRLK